MNEVCFCINAYVLSSCTAYQLGSQAMYVCVVNIITEQQSNGGLFQDRVQFTVFLD